MAFSFFRENPMLSLGLSKGPVAWSSILQNKHSVPRAACSRKSLNVVIPNVLSTWLTNDISIRKCSNAYQLRIVFRLSVVVDGLDNCRCTGGNILTSGSWLGSLLLRFRHARGLEFGNLILGCRLLLLVVLLGPNGVSEPDWLPERNLFIFRNTAKLRGLPGSLQRFVGSVNRSRDTPSQRWKDLFG